MLQLTIDATADELQDRAGARIARVGVSGMLCAGLPLAQRSLMRRGRESFHGATAVSI